MAEAPFLEGIQSTFIETPRIKMRVLTSGPEGGVPVVLVHGNVSAARFWEETMQGFAPTYRVLAPDLRGYGLTEALPIDATRGLRDWSDDLKSLVDTLRLGKFHLVGWSMGAGVAMQYAIDHSDELLSLTFISPVSPFGFGGTKDAAGTPTYDDFAGSGGGTVNPEFLKSLAAGERGPENPMGALNTMNAFYFKPPFKASPEREEVFVTEMLSTRIGDDFYPGDMTTSDHWPNVAPGTRGINNSMAPNWCNLSAFAEIDPKPPLLWVRGADDQVVSDTSFFDLGFLGQIGAVPGWPGEVVFPPQPMVSQTRYVLDQYRDNGGFYKEAVIEDAGHTSHVEKPEEFQQLALKHFNYATGQD